MRKVHRSWLVVGIITTLVVAFGLRNLVTTTQGQEQRVATPTQFIWSSIKTAGGPASLNVYRAQVPGGWLVLVHDEKERSQTSGKGLGHGVGIGSGVTFVPDPEHTWKKP